MESGIESPKPMREAEVEETKDAETPAEAPWEEPATPAAAPETPAEAPQVLAHVGGQQHPKVALQGTKRPREDLAEDELQVSSKPPEVLTEKAIYMRLHRVFKKRKDGTFQLEDSWNSAWTDVHGGGRDQLYSIFEKVGYHTDRVGENRKTTAFLN